MRVVEIFKSIDGEGVRAGMPVTFIRLEGCNLRCSFCDTKYSYCNATYTEMTPKQIVQKVMNLGLDKVTLTGGEPLIHENVLELVQQLLDRDIEINIETNGAVSVPEFVFNLTKSGYSVNNIIFTIDCKCPSSGMTKHMLEENLEYVRDTPFFNVLKFVVGNRDDLHFMKDMVNMFGLYDKCVFVSPVFGDIEPSEIVKFVLKYPSLHNVRTQIQLHKVIWDPNKRGV